MIDISQLEFSYPNSNFRLAIPQLTAAPGEKVAVIGPSGSGKTTLLNLIAGILTAQSRKSLICGCEISGQSDKERRGFRIANIGFVFQDFELLDYLNIFDNLLHPYRISNTLRITAQVRQRAQQLASEMEIEDKLRSYPENLSQGERQRAAICRALLPEPKLILADEATGSLDPANKIKIMNLLCQAADKRQATLLAVTHDHDLLNLFDRVIDFKDFIKTDD